MWAGGGAAATNGAGGATAGTGGANGAGAAGFGGVTAVMPITVERGGATGAGAGAVNELGSWPTCVGPSSPISPTETGSPILTTIFVLPSTTVSPDWILHLLTF